MTTQQDTTAPKPLGRQLAAIHWHMTKRYQEWWTLAELRATLAGEGIGVRLIAASGNKYVLTRKDKAMLKEAGTVIRQLAEALALPEGEQHG
jgi:hypothetical protein